MAHWLRVLTVVAETQVQSAAPTSKGSQAPVTPAPGDMVPHTHRGHINSHRHTHAHTFK